MANPAAVLADIVAPPHSLTMSYNISLNLSSLFAYLPSRIFARMRKGVGSQIEATVTQLAEAEAESWAMSATQVTDHDALSTPVAMTRGLGSTLASSLEPSSPGPWAFLTSGYMLGLLLMAIILHRMQNIIIPSRILFGRHNRPRRGHQVYRRALILRRLYSSLLPLDLSRTSTRLMIHLPTLYFLSKMMILWFIVILQTSDLLPASIPEYWGLHWLSMLLTWSREKAMSDICWSTFCAVCGAFCVEGFVKALDGIGSGFPLGGNTNPSTSPFNLVGYAFFLHIYSSPANHTASSDDFPSRPDMHIIIAIAIPLLQLTIFHYLSISKRLSTHRLYPTALSSFLSLVHFHLTILSHALSSSSSPSSKARSKLYFGGVNPLINSNGDDNTTRALIFPFPNYIPNVFETLLILTILLTVTLNAIVQLLVRGRIDRVFIGLGISSGADESGSISFHLPHEEDFGVLLLRMGTASLEATGLRGWGNEVAPVPAPVRRPSERIEQAAHEYGVVRMGRVDVGAVTIGVETSSGGTVRKLKGLRNEVRKVDLGTGTGTEDVLDRRRQSWRYWLREVRRFVSALWGVVSGAVAWVWDVARGRKNMWRLLERRNVRNREVETGLANPTERDNLVIHDEIEADDDLYRRFLLGDNISDDDNDEAVDQDDDDEEDEEDSGYEEDDSAREAIRLFSDVMRSGDDESGGDGEMLLAHLLHGSGPSRETRSGPLTRRRWVALYEKPSEEHAQEPSFERVTWEPSMNAQHGSEERDLDKENSARNWCVICTIEGRDIICWPCRCLAMCDACREALAARSPPAKHRCPCCRQLVEGYSKIYVP